MVLIINIADKRKYFTSEYSVWENDSIHIYTIKQICDRINITTDLDSLDKMHFDVVLAISLEYLERLQ